MSEEKMTANNLYKLLQEYLEWEKQQHPYEMPDFSLYGFMGFLGELVKESTNGN